LRPRLTAALLALFIVAGTVFAGTPAQAADFDPALGGSSSAARQFKINVLGKLLGKAAPTSWQREQLANANRYNQGWETLEAMYGTSANKGYSGPPDSYEDYVIRKKELETTGKLTVSGPGGTTTQKGSGETFKAPASGPSKFVKGAAGTAAVVSGAGFGLQIGNAGADLGLSLFGLDKDGLICGPTSNGTIQKFASYLNGTDCSLLDYAPEFVPNLDADGEGFSMTLCADIYGGCLDYAGSATASPNSSTHYSHFCFAAPSNFPESYDAKDQPTVYWYDGRQQKYAAQYISKVQSWEMGFTNGCSNGAAAQIGYAGTKENAVLALGDGPMCVSRGIYTATKSVCTDGTIPADKLAMPQQVTSDPARTLSCSIVGTDGKTYTAESEPFRETDDAMAQPKCPALPEGVAPASGKIEQNNKENGAKETLAPIDVNQEFLDWWKSDPECRTGACTQDLFKKNADGTRTDCFENVTACADWFEDPAKEKNYQCVYNDRDVELANCYVYSGMFKPGRVASGNPYSDPLTGKWSGGQNSKAIDETAYATPIANPDTVRSCLKEAGSLNPIEWVMVPVQCALQWAFVPRPAVLATNTAALSETWDKTTPAKFATFMGGVAVTPNVTGCGGIPLDLPFLYDMGVPRMAFGEACPGTWTGNIAATVRVVLIALVTWGGIVGISRNVAGVINYRGIE
jgi:hypothetical protein